MPLNKTFANQLKTSYAINTTKRHKIIATSNELLYNAKRVIFATHRGELIAAGASLAALDKDLLKLQKDFGYQRLNEEGSYSAAVEEYVEAKLFYAASIGQTINRIPKIKIANEQYLGGLSDLTGELVRQAVNSAADGRWEKVRECHDLIKSVLVALTEMDLTGYLRTKYDQAKSNLRKIEQMAYEIKLKK
ncbi:hypothetical protein COT94_00835 [Candidatus Falkowbacteria bacterium CG10_big_fil_rev_8_21_14_0_10_37_14]|uniref:Haloacid dehalogenase n=1 Tax=Candidatus Falkowbacteria bacterium CG10_big_fil_rev_8_21_14_0_10_37_14 TaxID=1974561 RepID=A0A2M6WU93_9BACT|nr:hypothetical protein [Candidatus Falkowbacteria bacterium]PIT96367.1 MAG: hypothetical protein COT94_00835 [Candidatus Falkowbacteria bacterium CG10_big_fil_rev_8_21_14_0_10_37_14]